MILVYFNVKQVMNMVGLRWKFVSLWKVCLSLCVCVYHFISFSLSLVNFNLLIYHHYYESGYFCQKFKNIFLGHTNCSCSSRSSNRIPSWIFLSFWSGYFKMINNCHVHTTSEILFAKFVKCFFSFIIPFSSRIKSNQSHWLTKLKCENEMNLFRNFEKIGPWRFIFSLLQ